MNYWALFIGGVLAGIPQILQTLGEKGKVSPLGDPGHWPVHLAFGLLGIIAAISIWRKHDTKHVQIAWPVILWLGFVLWAWLVPWLVDLYSIAEWKYSSGRLTLYLGFLLLGSAWFVSGRNRERDFYQFILGFAGWLSIDYVFRFLSAGTEALHDPYIVPGLMGHKNFTSSAIALSLAFVFIGWWKGFYDAGLAIGVLSTGAIAIVMAQTRSIWLASAVAVGIGVFFAVTSKGSFQKIIIGTIGIITGAIGLVLLFLLSSPVQERIMDPSNLKIRKVFWEHSLQMSAEHPLTGVGPGQWRIHFPKYGLTGMNPSVAEGVTAEVRPHNDFIWILSEMGSIGLLFFVGFFVWVGWIAIKRYRAQPKELEQSAWLSILALVLIYASFEFPIERAAFFIPFIFMVGHQINGGIHFPLKGVLKDGNQINGGIRFPMKGVLIATIGILGAGTLVAWKATKADQQNELINQQNSQKNAIAIEQSALDSYSEWNEMDRFGNPIMYFAGMGSLFNEANSFGPNPTFTSENFTRAEEYFNQALEIHPYHVVTLYQLANLHRYRNEYESAKGVYERLLAISPRHPGGQLHYAVTLNALGNYEGAARVLVSAFLEKSYYESPDYQRAVVEALRKMPNQVKHEGLKPFLISRNQLSDEQLFQAFQLAKEKRLKEAQKH